MTRNGVEYESAKTPYNLLMNGMELRFSSESIMKRFNDKIAEAQAEQLNWIHSKLGDNVQVFLEMDDYAIIRTYLKCEFRFFHMIIEGVDVKCLKNLVLNGTRVNRNHFQMLYASTTLQSQEH